MTRSSLTNPLWLRRLLQQLNSAALFNNGWGREPDGGKPAEPPKEEGEKPADPPKATGGNGSNNDGKPPKSGDEPPDLEEVWREFNKKLGGLFGNKPKSNRPTSADLGPKKGTPSPNDDSSSKQSAQSNQPPRMSVPNPQAFTAIASVAALVIAAFWFATGFYIVQEGQVAVITQFGKYQDTAGAGLHWRLPYPVQNDQRVDISRVRKVEIGTKAKSGSARLKEALMLTDDENIVDVQFEVQYRIREGGAPGFLFSNRTPENAVMQAAESAMREEVGRRTIDEVLNKGRQDVANAVEKRIQTILDRYKIRRTDVAGEAYFDSGILVTAVAIQNAQPPEPVQAAFDDAVKAVQDKERAISEGQAYANDVVPRAKGAASRLVSEAEGYKQRVSQTAEGDAARFKSVVTEYAKAPAVTRQRMYLDTMQQVFESTSKVVVDTKGNGNMLYLPLDKIIAQTTAESNRATTESAGAAPPAQSAPPAAANQPKDAKDTGLRTRDLRDVR